MRVFRNGSSPKVFVNPPAEWRARDVNNRREDDVLVPRPRFLAEHVAVSRRQVHVPGGTQGAQRRHPGRIIVGASGGVPRVRPDVLAHAVRAVVNPAARDAQPRNGGGGEFGIGMDLRNLLLQRHATQQVFDAFLDGLVGVEIERRWFLNRLNLDRLVLRGLNLGRRLRGRLDLDPRRWGRLVLLGAEEGGSQSQQEQPQDTRQTTQAARDEFHGSHSRTVEQGGINASLKLHLHLFALISDAPVRLRGE